MNEQQAHEKIKQMIADGIKFSLDEYYNMLHKLMGNNRTTPSVVYTVYPRVKERNSR